MLKIMMVNIFAIGIGMLVVWLAVDIQAADFTTGLMREFGIVPVRIHWLFLSGMHRYLLWSTVVALALAAVFSLLLTRRVLRPLADMRHATARIAAGDYTARVTTSTRDEIARFAADLNRMAESLQHIERLRKDMVADVAHELRTPLTNMRGYIEGLADGVVPPSKENFDRLQEETLRLVNLVEGLLELSKADAATLALHPARVALPEAIAQTLAMASPLGAHRSLRVEQSLADEAGTVWADPDRLGQVLHNLLDNAHRYAAEGGRLRIETSCEGQTVRVTFGNDCEDTSGLNPELLFERFYRGEKSRSRRYGGAGIGLSIVKKLVEVQGGRVGARVTAGWFEVWFTLPRSGI